MPGYLVTTIATNAFTPSGTISSTTVGGALEELDTEKASLTYVDSEVTRVERIALLGYI